MLVSNSFLIFEIIVLYHNLLLFCSEIERALRRYTSTTLLCSRQPAYLSVRWMLKENNNGIYNEERRVNASKHNTYLE